MYINIYVYIVFLKKNKEAPPPSYLNLLLRHLLMLQVVPLKDYYLNECFHETSELTNLLKLLEQSLCRSCNFPLQEASGSSFSFNLSGR
jgi:hypothetical protein